MQQLQDEKDAIIAERKRAEEMMAQLLTLKEQMAGTASAGGEPAQPAEGQVDVAAMMAELAALRAQVAEQKNESEENKEDVVHS